MRSRLCFFLISALRILFLGPGWKRGQRKGGELVRCLRGILARLVGAATGFPVNSEGVGRYVWLPQVEPEAAAALGDHQSRGVNPDASEILHINRKKTLLM